MTDRKTEALATLTDVQQGHLLDFFDELNPVQQTALLDQIDGIAWGRIDAWAEHVHGADAHADAEAAEPVVVLGLEDSEVRVVCAARGEEAIRAGRVAAFTVAGGQGSRLGYDGPKGEFPAGPVSKMSLFAWFANGLLAAQDTYGVTVPWYIMTSTLNHVRTVAFFASNDFFGLDRDAVKFFPQGVLPTFGMDGRVLLAEKGVIATNPDGHGGSLAALKRSGALAGMHGRGVDLISYFQVDNPAVRVVDPVFIGLHLDTAGNQARSSGEMSTKIVRKTRPDERVGVLGKVGAYTNVFEYSDLSEAQSAARTASGALRFDAANMAVHIIGVSFVERLNASGALALPLHRAVKQVRHLDHHGRPILSDAVKLETFVFDALPQCTRTAVLEADRVEEFAPIKNAEGNDSPATSAALLSESAARFLEARGAKVARALDGGCACLIELSPRRRAALQGTSLEVELEPGEDCLI